MTKQEEQDLKLAFELNEWEDFLLVLKEIRARDKEIRARDKEVITFYRKSHRHLKRLKKGCNNAINELKLINGSDTIAIMELEKALEKEV
jgi:hypothetical protein